MALYLVERSLPGLGPDDLVAVQRALLASCDRLAAAGASVAYLHSLFAPTTARCLCLFRATSWEAVNRANETAQVPFTRIEEVVDLQPPAR
jgi:hypothetical protein